MKYTSGVTVEIYGGCRPIKRIEAIKLRIKVVPRVISSFADKIALFVALPQQSNNLVNEAANLNVDIETKY